MLQSSYAVRIKHQRLPARYETIRSINHREMASSWHDKVAHQSSNSERAKKNFVLYFVRGRATKRCAQLRGHIISRKTRGALHSTAASALPHFPSFPPVSGPGLYLGDISSILRRTRSGWLLHTAASTLARGKAPFCNRVNKAPVLEYLIRGKSCQERTFKAAWRARAYQITSSWFVPFVILIRGSFVAYRYIMTILLSRLSLFASWRKTLICSTICFLIL